MSHKEIPEILARFGRLSAVYCESLEFREASSARGICTHSAHFLLLYQLLERRVWAQGRTPERASLRHRIWEWSRSTQKGPSVLWTLHEYKVVIRRTGPKLTHTPGQGWLLLVEEEQKSFLSFVIILGKCHLPWGECWKNKSEVLDFWGSWLGSDWVHGE